MGRLAAYLVRLFSVDAIALLAIVSFLMFLVQTLRTFDLVTVKGQDLGTLVGQTLLSMPTLVVGFAYVCIGIGLARGLRALQLSHELHVIHAERRVPGLLGAIALYTLIAAAAVLVLSNLVEPLTKRYHNTSQSAIAAELVSRTLTPNKFVEISPGVTLIIGSRGRNGELGSFFADDRRDNAARRTFIARSATFAADEAGFVIRLRNGFIQNLTPDQRYSEIAFETYDLTVDRLSRRSDAPAGGEERTTPDLVAEGLAKGFTPDVLSRITARFAEGFRVIAICLLVAALAMFPSGRRGSARVPIEIVVVLAAFFERASLTVPPISLLPVPVPGAVVMAIASLGAIALQLGLGRSAPHQRAPT